MASNTSDSLNPCLTWPPITSYPTDGFGGSYYEYLFSVPVYATDNDFVLNSISWSLIDEWHRKTASIAIGSAVVFGVCVTTLFNVLILTPQHRRRLALHTFICLALAFQIVRHTTILILLTQSLPASSYLYLTIDFSSITVSRTCHALVSISQISACLSFILVQACFFVQGRALMTWLHIHHRHVYFLVLTYLIVAGAVATIFRIGSAIYQILDLLSVKTTKGAGIVMQGSLIIYAVSIASWSLVFFVSAMSITISRRRVLFGSGSLYDRALNLVAIIGLESFIVPILFCIMQFPSVNWLVSPEHFIVPSVLFLLPIGGLFLAIHTKEDPKKDTFGPPAHTNQIEIPHSETSDQKRTTAAILEHDTADVQTMHTYNEHTAELPVSSSCAKQAADHSKNALGAIDAELALIDALDREGVEVESSRYSKDLG